MFERIAKKMAGSQDRLVESYQAIIQQMVIKNIGRPIHDYHDVLVFFDTLSDDELFRLLDVHKYFLTGTDFERSFYIVTYEMFSDEEFHNHFLYETLPLFVFMIFAKRYKYITDFTFEDDENITFKIDKKAKKKDWDTFFESLSEKIKKQWKSLMMRFNL